MENLRYNDTMNEEKRKVAVIGALNVDISGRAEAPLARGDSVMGKVRTTLGGVGWNVARNCALLGADVSFYSLLGRDGQADAIRAESARYVVDISGCRWVDEQNNRYLYICDEHGDVACCVNDMALCSQMDKSFAARCLDAVQDCGAVVADANLPQGTLSYIGENLTAPLVVDCVSTAKCVRLRPILGHIHTLKANLSEAETLIGEKGPEACIKALLAAGVRRVVISMASEGVICGEAGGEIFAKRSVHTEVVDATGAGDSMTAALTVGLAAGMSFTDCASMGVTAAGITIANPGAVTSALAVLRPF